MFISVRLLKYVGNGQGSSQNLPRRGRGTARRRWMRGGTALNIVGTMGAEGIKPSLTVGNGLCAVPPRCEYNPCGQPEPPPDMSFRANAVSRGIFPSSRFYLVVVHSPPWWIPPLRLRCGRNDNDVTFLRIRLQFLERFRSPRPSSVRAAPCQLPRRGSFCTVTLGVEFIDTPQESSKKTFPAGEGGPPAGGG